MRKTKIAALIFAFGFSGSALGKMEIAKEELSSHNTESDCWMAIDGAVYDMTKYIEIHKEECKKINFTDYCGRDASEVWKKKEAGKIPHKKKSYRRFEEARIGRLVTP